MTLPLDVNAMFSRLRLRQLGLVIALDGNRSLRKAAAELAMTQSAASKALAEIESVLGGPLFERSRSGMAPNALGRCVIRYAWLLRSELGAMCQEIANIQRGTGGRIAVGTIMGAVPRLLTGAIEILRRAQPAASVEIVEDTSSRLLALLDQGQLDLMIGRTIVSARPQLYRYEELSDEPLSVAAGVAHPLARARTLKFQDLRAYDWIVYPSQMPLLALLERELTEAGMTMPSHLIETASTFTTVALLCRNAHLVALLPADVCAFFAAQKLLRALPVKLRSRMQPFGIVTRASGTPSPITLQFMQALREARAGAVG
jgi:DNA-binding transcriptional LysR family regulator